MQLQQHGPAWSESFAKKTCEIYQDKLSLTKIITQMHQLIIASQLKWINTFRFCVLMMREEACGYDYYFALSVITPTKKGQLGPQIEEMLQ